MPVPGSPPGIHDVPDSAGPRRKSSRRCRRSASRYSCRSGRNTALSRRWSSTTSRPIATNHDVFIGAYPNGATTLASIREAKKQVKNVHLAVCPHDGPTSKADNLNWIYQRLLLFEEEEDAHFDIIMTHDAEDIILPDSRRWINDFAEKYDMVQAPVMALPTPFPVLTHGVYCDEFAEFQMRGIGGRAI